LEADFEVSDGSSSSDSGNEDTLAVEDLDHDLDYIEIKQADGTYMKVKNAAVNNEDILGFWEKWDRNRVRAGIRFAVVIARHVCLP
jgi:hypothetical protein